MKTFRTIVLSFALLAFYSSSNAQSMNGSMQMPVSNTTIVKAVCVLYPTQGNSVTGTITFIKVPDGVRVVADLQGLTPGKHGIHIHECGDCSSSDGSSAGGHFNPMAKSHGSPMDEMRHEGDMGNIEADASGRAHLDYVDKNISFEGISSIIGRSVIVHKNEDDFKTQPTGNAGARVACGVIGIGK